ncbi:transcriptional regulator GutM [Garciella nitratireducens]|uniref:Glucitol operon activator protein (GutM) n=1 Tax=Garciella nitratireducens DSM 15102 TaxID=1121911 RepID=A0A1T4P9T9_9FIRM|nr:transcriptional regulator GutM [Garciella nitratireducens]SJZ88294.1 Glucitol operon activator protein (GutM) [Garciella nitratireducens DSM 15102]
MNSTFFLIMICITGFLLQSFLGLQQIKHFNKEYVKMRKEGKVAIGRRPGKIRAGTLVMFCLDQEGVIQYGRKMQGITVLARFKDLKGYEGVKIDSLDKESRLLKKESKLIRECILNAVETYNLVIHGKEIAIKEPPLTSLKKKVKNLSFSK